MKDKTPFDEGYDAWFSGIFEPPVDYNPAECKEWRAGQVAAERDAELNNLWYKDRGIF